VSSAQRERLAQSVGSAIGSVSAVYQQHKANKAAAQQQQQGTAEGPAGAQRRAIDDFEFEAREFEDGELLVARGGLSILTNMSTTDRPSSKKHDWQKDRLKRCQLQQAPEVFRLVVQRPLQHPF
jgi:hypothetical protein